MTPAERASQIDRYEFEAECAAVRQRAYADVARRRQQTRDEIANWLGREPPKQTFRTYRHNVKSAPRQARKIISERHTIGDLSLTMGEWAEHIGVSRVALSTRIHRQGSLEAAVAMGGPLRAGPTRRHPGVVSNLPASLGTGGGRSVYPSANIAFSEKAEIA